MKTHYLKTIPPYFQDVLDYKKNFEYRKNDRNFQAGDILKLKEWQDNVFTGRMVTVRVVYLFEGFPNLPADYCILGIAPIHKPVEEYDVDDCDCYECNDKRIV